MDLMGFTLAFLLGAATGFFVVQNNNVTDFRETYCKVIVAPNYKVIVGVNCKVLVAKDSCGAAKRKDETYRKAD